MAPPAERSSPSASSNKYIAHACSLSLKPERRAGGTYVGVNAACARSTVSNRGYDACAPAGFEIHMSLSCR